MHNIASMNSMRNDKYRKGSILSLKYRIVSYAQRKHASLSPLPSPPLLSSPPPLLPPHAHPPQTPRSERRPWKLDVPYRCACSTADLRCMLMRVPAAQQRIWSGWGLGMVKTVGTEDVEGGSSRLHLWRQCMGVFGDRK